LEGGLTKTEVAKQMGLHVSTVGRIANGDKARPNPSGFRPIPHPDVSVREGGDPRQLVITCDGKVELTIML
jgi:hypothetical protein